MKCAILVSYFINSCLVCFVNTKCITYYYYIFYYYYILLLLYYNIYYYYITLLLLLHIILSIDGCGMANIDSPPSLKPTAVKCLGKENIENIFIWSVIKDVRPNFLFTKRTNYFGWNTISDATTTNQLGRLNFCSKVSIIYFSTQ